jgi:hypothetical protein
VVKEDENKMEVKLRGVSRPYLQFESLKISLLEKADPEINVL